MQAALCKFGKLWENRNNGKKTFKNIVSTMHGDPLPSCPAPPALPNMFPVQVLKYLNAYSANHIFSIWLHFSPSSCETYKLKLCQTA